MKQISDKWRGLSKSLVVALVFWAVFLAGVGFDWLQHITDRVATRKNLLYQDFGQLGFYGAANSALPPDPHRIIFFGDSITYQWNLGASFPGEPYLNRGIRGQTTSQMLVRYRQDVLELHPTSIVILAGFNDLGDTSAVPTPIPDIERNLQTMAELAILHHIRPVFASLLPVYNDKLRFPIMETRIPQGLLEINKWLKSYCDEQGYTYIDYYAAMVSPDGKMRKDLSDDGIHPNAAGYAIMASTAKESLSSNPSAKQDGPSEPVSKALVILSGTVPRSSRPYHDERVFGQSRRGNTRVAYSIA
jgi:lysophospholipase L1-like esterase